MYDVRQLRTVINYVTKRKKKKKGETILQGAVQYRKAIMLTMTTQFISHCRATYAKLIHQPQLEMVGTNWHDIDVNTASRTISSLDKEQGEKLLSTVQGHICHVTWQFISGLACKSLVKCIYLLFFTPSKLSVVYLYSPSLLLKVFHSLPGYMTKIRTPVCMQQLPTCLHATVKLQTKSEVIPDIRTVPQDSANVLLQLMKCRQNQRKRAIDKKLVKMPK